MCRTSDAALIEITISASNWDFGYLARPINRAVGVASAGSITIDGSNPKLSLIGTSNLYFVGDTLEKIGQQTGWTAGEVTQSCVYI